jgi:hypothetical protein
VSELVGAGAAHRLIFHTTRQKRAEADEAGAPKVVPGCTSDGVAFSPVMGVRVFRAAVRVVASDSAKKVEVDALHGFRPRMMLLSENATKHAILRIRKFVGTKV